MAAFNYAPSPLQETFFIPGSNTPGNGVQLFIYVAGSSTKTTVYKDSGGVTAWSNPIVLDSGGNLPSGGVIWIPTGISIKAVWAPSNDTDPPSSPYRTIDNIVGINDSGSTSVSEWVSGPAPTFISATSFSVAGDQTATFSKYRRIRTTNTAGTVYSSILSATFGGGITTITVQSDSSGALDSGLSAVAYGIVDPAHPSVVAGTYIVTPMTTVANTSRVVIGGMSSDVLNTYLLNITDFKAESDGAGLYLQMSPDGGTTFISSAIYRTERIQIANATTAALGTTDTAGNIVGSSATSTLFPFTASLGLMNMGSAGQWKVVDVYVGYVDVGNVFVVNRGAIFGLTVSTITAIRLTPSPGNISTITYELLGTRRQ